MALGHVVSALADAAVHALALAGGLAPSVALGHVVSALADAVVHALALAGGLAPSVALVGCPADGLVGPVVVPGVLLAGLVLVAPGQDGHLAYHPIC